MCAQALFVRKATHPSRPVQNPPDSVRPKQLHGDGGARRLCHFCGLQHKLVRQAVAAGRLPLPSLTMHKRHQEKHSIKIWKFISTVQAT